MKRKKRNREVRFNTTALPDIVFMLLFFFMVVTVMKEDTSTRTVDLPYTEYSNFINSQDDAISITMYTNDSLQSEFYIESIKLHNRAELEKGIADLRSKYIANPDISIKIKIDKQTPMKSVNEVKSLLRDYQFYKVKYMIKNLSA